MGHGMTPEVGPTDWCRVHFGGTCGSATLVDPRVVITIAWPFIKLGRSINQLANRSADSPRDLPEIQDRQVSFPSFDRTDKGAMQVTPACEFGLSELY